MQEIGVKSKGWVLFHETTAHVYVWSLFYRTEWSRFISYLNQELMNHHSKKERRTSVPIQTHFIWIITYSWKRALRLLLWILKSLPAVTIATCWLLNQVGANIQPTL